MMKLSNYFDAAASTPLDPQVRDVIVQHLDLWGNNNSKHTAGQSAQKVIDDGLKTIAKALNCNWEQLSVTYSGTDSARRFIWECRQNFGQEKLWGSAVEHSSIRDEINPKNLFDPTNFSSIASDAKMIALMCANSETGRIYPADKLREQFPDTFIFRDYSQSVAKGFVPDLHNCDAAIFTPQKIYGPKHVGILYLKKPELFPNLSKDSHTKSASLVAGAAKAFEIWAAEREATNKKMQQWDDTIRDFITQNIPDHKFHEADAKKTPGIINVAFKRLRGSELMTVLAKEEQICISTGSACTTDMMAPTPVISFIESDPIWQYPIRVSLHKFLTDTDITDFCEVLEHYVKELRKWK